MSEKRGIVDSFFQRFTNQSSQKAGIVWLATAGFFKDQTDAFLSIDDETLIEKMAAYCQAVIPYLDAQNDRWKFRKMQAFLWAKSLYEIDAQNLADAKAAKPQNDYLVANMEKTVKLRRQWITDHAKTLIAITFTVPKAVTIDMQVPVQVNWGAQGAGPPPPRDSEIPFTDPREVPRR